MGETSVARFSIASNRKHRGRDGETREDVTYVDCEAWGRTAELVAQYLSKGSGALVEGRLKLDRWDDKDGNKRSQLRVVAERVQFIGGPPQRSAGGPAKSRATSDLYGADDCGPEAGADEPPF